MKLVSIIIPYNIDRGWLNEAIESVENQTYPNIELILSQSDNGVSYNINRGIEKAKGEYIKFFAEDDLLMANCIEDSVKAIEGFDFIHGNAYNFNSTDGRVVSAHKPKIKQPTLKDMINHNHIHGGTLMYRKDVFERFGMFDESLWTGEEYEYNLRILSMGAKLNYLDKVVFNYRLHPKQKSIGNKAFTYQNKRKKAIKEIKEKYSKPLKIIVGIATFKGREEFLKKTVESLKGQCDELWVYDNERNFNKADNGKFYPLSQINHPCYFLSCDDDIIYPPTYCQDMIDAIERTGTIVTHHGRTLQGVDRSYYRGHRNYRCSDFQGSQCRIDVAGTGVTGFRTDYFNPTEIHKAEDLRMSDLVFSLEAAKQGKDITVLPHNGNYFKVQNVPVHETIYGMEHLNENRQIEIANEIYNLRYGKRN